MEQGVNIWPRRLQGVDLTHEAYLSIVPNLNDTSSNIRTSMFDINSYCRSRT